MYKHLFLGGLNLNNWTTNNNTGTNGMYSPQPGPPPTTPQHAPSTTPQHGVTTTPQHQAKSPADVRPDYSRSHFDNAFNKNDKPKQAKTGDIFGDLLGSQGYEFAAKKENTPKTINDMRKTELAKEMDPDKLKIMEWVM